MRTKIESTVNFSGLSVRIDQFLNLWSTYAGRSIKQIPFKRDLRGWNDGLTSMQPLKTIACYAWCREEGNYCVGVYEIWERKDGYSIECFKFDTIEDYNNYDPCQDSPDAINREIGLCENYHKGI